MKRIDTDSTVTIIYEEENAAFQFSRVTRRLVGWWHPFKIHLAKVAKQEAFQ